MKSVHISLNEATKLDIVSMVIAFICVVVVVVAIEFSAPIIAGTAAVSAAATGVWRAQTSHRRRE